MYYCSNRIPKVGDILRLRDNLKNSICSDKESVYLVIEVKENIREIRNIFVQSDYQIETFQMSDMFICINDDE